jgi:hypothetical protein
LRYIAIRDYPPLISCRYIHHCFFL